MSELLRTCVMDVLENAVYNDFYGSGHKGLRQ